MWLLALWCLVVNFNFLLSYSLNFQEFYSPTWQLSSSLAVTNKGRLISTFGGKWTLQYWKHMKIQKSDGREIKAKCLKREAICKIKTIWGKFEFPVEGLIWRHCLLYLDAKGKDYLPKLGAWALQLHYENDPNICKRESCREAEVQIPLLIKLSSFWWVKNGKEEINHPTFSKKRLIVNNDNNNITTVFFHV